MTQIIKYNKTLLVILILLTFFSCPAAQIGIKAGGNLSFLTLSKSQDSWDNTLSWQVGVCSSIRINRFWHFNPEIILTNFRSQLSSRFEDFSVSWIMSRTQLQIPLLFKWMPFARKERWQPIFLLGPQFGLNLGQRLDMTLDAWKTEISMSDTFVKTDYSLVSAIGLELPLSKGKTRLTAELRYSLSIKNQAMTDHFDDNEYKQSSIMLLTGILF